MVVSRIVSTYQVAQLLSSCIEDGGISFWLAGENKKCRRVLPLGRRGRKTLCRRPLPSSHFAGSRVRFTGIRQGNI